MTKFLVGLLAAAAQNKEVQAFVTDKLVPALGKALKEQLLPELIKLFPLFGAGLLKEVFEKVPGVGELRESVTEIATGAMEQLDKDPDLGKLSEIIDFSEIASDWLSKFGFGRR